MWLSQLLGRKPVAKALTTGSGVYLVHGTVVVSRRRRLLRSQTDTSFKLTVPTVKVITPSSSTD